MCIGKLTTIGSDNAMSPGRRHCWNSVDWTIKKTRQWNFNQNSNIFIQENALENVVREMASILSWPQCVEGRPSSSKCLLGIAKCLAVTRFIYHHNNFHFLTLLEIHQVTGSAWELLKSGISKFSMLQKYDCYWKIMHWWCMQLSCCNGKHRCASVAIAGIIIPAPCHVIRALWLDWGCTRWCVQRVPGHWVGCDD